MKKEISSSPQFGDGDQSRRYVWMDWKFNKDIRNISVEASNIQNVHKNKKTKTKLLMKGRFMLSCLCWADCCRAVRRPRLWGCPDRGTSAGFRGRLHPRSLCSLE